MSAGSIKNPVEQQLEWLARAWIAATQDPQARVLVLRSRDDARDVVRAFLAYQAEQPGASGIPDLFAHFSSPFLTGYDYSQSLVDELTAKYQASDADGPQWQAAAQIATRAAETLAVFQDFAAHHHDRFRYLIAVPAPSPISDDALFTHWINEAQPRIPERVRLVLCDTGTLPVWQPLLDKAPSLARLIELPTDGMLLMRETLNQQPAGGRDSDAPRFRALLLDCFILLEKGAPEAFMRRARQALTLADKKGWHAQGAVIHNMAGGSHLKAGDAPKAIAAYQDAHKAAQHIPEADLRLQHLMQAEFSLGGVYYGSGDFAQAAVAYTAAAGWAQQAGNTYYAIEGHRMTGHCQLRLHRPGEASAAFARAMQLGKPLPPGQRQMTTLPFLFQDLLRFHDAPRADALGEQAQHHQRQCAGALAASDEQVQRLPVPVSADDVDAANERLHKALIEHFNHTRQRREQLILQGDADFQHVVMLARQYLHPAWNGLPEIAHPLDAPSGAWDAMPDYLAAPQENLADAFISHYDKDDSSSCV